MEENFNSTKKFDLSNRFFVLVAILIIGAIVYFVGQVFYQFSSLPQNYPQEIMVTGQGKAFAKPDIASVTLGVTTEGLESSGVVTKNNEKMNAVIKAVKEDGVVDEDIQTSAYNLSPVYDYTERGRVFKGYSLNQQITVKIRNFDKIGSILDKATSAGANTVGDLQFTIDNPETIRAGARQKAIDEAKAKATLLAQQAGLRLVKLVNISEDSSPIAQPMYGMGGGGEMSKALSIVPDIQTGQMEINSTVYLTYRVK